MHIPYIFAHALMSRSICFRELQPAKCMQCPPQSFQATFTVLCLHWQWNGHEKFAAYGRYMRPFNYSTRLYLSYWEQAMILSDNSGA